MEQVVSITNVSKSFGSIKANNKVSFSVNKNEVHAVMGENGAGKSTIMSVLFGLYERDEGSISVRGKDVFYKSSRDAARDGISMLPQHFKLIDNMTVLENVILGSETSKAFVLDKRAARKKLKQLMETFKLPLDANVLVDRLSVSEKQRVEILKILWVNADIIIMDEPTSILTPQEVENFLSLVEEFKRQGKTIIIITHKLEEVKRIADRCTVMRRGQVVATKEVSDLDEQEMAHMMIGQQIDLNLSSIPKNRMVDKPTNLSLEKLFLRPRLGQKPVENVSLEIRAGEIMGIAAIEGNGQQELLEIVAGMRLPDAGSVKIGKTDITK